MSILKIPSSGLELGSSSSSSGILPMQAFGIILDNDVLEEMIRSVGGGQDVELILGSTPSFQFGSREEEVLTSPDSLNYDIYVTDLRHDAGKTERLPNPTMSMHNAPSTSIGKSKKGSKITTKKLTMHRSKIANVGPKGAKLLPSGRGAMASVLSSTARSLPSSPALNGVASPNPAFSASQQVLEKNKGQRSILVHELAARDQSYEHLQDVWIGADSDLKPTVEKVADFNKSTGKWSLKRIYWKELDVWNYDYDKPEDRQSAIDNAIKTYDKQRVGTSDPVWERLLPKEERGKGIVLSKLQATIAKKTTTALPPAPKTGAQKGEDGNKSDIDSSKAKGEPMSRSNSQPVGAKSKKLSDRDAQTKRLLSNNPKKPAPKKPASKAKVVEEKGKKVLSEEFVYDTDTSHEDAPLSQNTATNQKPAPARKAVEKAVVKPPVKPAAKPVAKLNEKPKETPTPAATSKAKSRPVVRAPKALGKPPASTNKSPQKRARDEEDSSSSSGAPLSKRLKAKELPKQVAEAPKNPRVSDASLNSRGTTSNLSSATSSSLGFSRNKNTSPVKSSPLAASPPTNAADLDVRRPVQKAPKEPPPHQQQQARVGERDRATTNGNVKTTSTSTQNSAMASKKRKEPEAVDESPETTPTPPTKKPRVSKDVLVQAKKFTQFYKKYETLHYEIASLKVPPEDKLADLLEMRERLVTMKRDIQRAVAAENE
ncbi:hypothetical protein GGS20DRAFT_592568 [Poronia punctata]|nr:hypothetical protein GGS20DRAFT_592568 [Poronia punctata]